ncbi:MAG TPA: hypothetical protein VGO22_04515 [Pseudorhizobium sp.]|jgi:hypothetical protein|nr:hypothetical protein [Pseudorhizobium sp.]
MPDRERSMDGDPELMISIIATPRFDRLYSPEALELRMSQDSGFRHST